MKKLEKQTLASNKLRLFSIFIAVFLIPMLLMCIMNLWAVHNDTINTASQFTGQLLQQNSTTIDNVLRLIDGSFSQLFMNGDVLDFFQATSLPSTFDEYKGIADIFSEMRSVLDRGNGYVSNIYLYNENTDVLLTSRQSMKYETKLNEKPFFDSFIEKPGFHVGSYKINGREEAYIIASRVVYSHMMRSGIILVELNRDRLHQLLDKMSTNNSGSILIIDDEGNMVVPNETIRSSQIIETIAAPNHSRIQMNLNDEEYLIYTQKSSINFWTYIWMVPCSILNHSSSSIITRMLLIHIVFFLAVVVGSYFLSREMFLPFISLYNRMIGKDTRGNSYLLKRLAIMSELDKGITQMRGELAEVRASGNIIQSENVALREQINQYTREYCDRFVQRLIDGNPIGSTEISGLVEMEHIPVDCSSVIAIIQTKEFSYWKIDERLRNLLQCCVENTEKFDYRLLSQIESCFYVLFIFEPSNVSKERGMLSVVNALEALRQNLTEEIQKPICIVLGDHINDLQFLDESFEAANMRLKYANALGRLGVLYNLKEQKVIPEQLLDHNDALNQALDNDDLEYAVEETKTILIVLQGQMLPSAFCMLFLKNIASMFLQYMVEHGFSKQQIDQTYEDIQRFFTKFESIAEAADYISDLMRIIQEKYHAIPKRARKIAEQAREIIHNEFATDISLQETAERLGVNASYLSRIFKESIGINFKEYLIEYKLTIAKKLLEEGINVTKVAEKVGYQDVRQFTRIFKKYMGVTPNVYQTSHKT